MLEELFTNTVEHGYPSDADAPAPVWITLEIADERIVALYEDAASAHNPFQSVCAPDYSGPAESWRLGGLGIVLVTRQVSDIHYERSDGHNRIRFALPVAREI